MSADAPLVPVSPATWDAGGTAFAWNGHRLFARVGGDGPALLLLHGFPTSSWDWARLWPALAATHCVLALDMLGFGRSDKPRGHRYSVLEGADQWVAFAQACGVSEARVVAHDYGDSVAQELLARQRDGTLPFRIASVVFLNGGLFPEAHHPIAMQRWLAGPLGPVIARFAGYPRFAASLRRICARPLPEEELREHWRLLERDGGRRALPALLGYLRERVVHRERWVGALVDSEVPRRLVVGLDDPIAGASIARRWRALVPDPDVVELTGVGHYPQVEDAASVLQAIEDFHAAGGAPAGRRNADALAFYDGVDRRAAP
jgi:pimeloyl-ACP methyl ester carboxylesterase